MAFFNGHKIETVEQVNPKTDLISIDGKIELFNNVELGVYGTFYGDQDDVNLVKEALPNAIITEDYPATSEHSGRYHVSSKK